ncbi:MAG: hypothetical protein DMD38_13695 [Gemmatimonadetes bacterium]|nr:MAG: hypothetical protein AUI86_08620 [Gemmatimonadetes bacterium 13_1_40CM_3_66_12]OLD85223.1 MAG: hypothetical protein AUG85_14305 [Gemmatimonadetes bacterium 13_1_20CM_4_66_11]PYP95049.1 MAG: hypothetical protein DMD38_13695 [Gemmatimonadota bacterium]
MHTVRSSLLALGTAVALALGVTACNNDSTTPATPIMSQVQAESLANTVLGDVAGEIATATMDGSNGAVASAPVNASAPAGSSAATQCIPAKSPTPVTDADNDGVPDSVRFDYAGCVISRPLSVDSLSGTIDLIDPTAATADHAVKRVFTDFKRITVNLVSGAKSSVTDNGVRQASHDGTTLRSSETNFRTDYVYANGYSAEHVRTWESIFTADVAGSIMPNALLPSGTWSVNGTSSWTRGQNSYSLTVTTNPALHYNASCTNAPRFDAGKITAVVVRNSKTMTVTIEFTACGVYTVTRS